MTFAIGSALAAAAGILFGLAYPVLDPYMGISFGWKAFVAAILGGRGSIMGACIAGFMLGFIEIMTVPAIQIINRLFSLNIGSNMRDLIAYSIVLADPDFPAPRVVWRGTARNCGCREPRNA
jgi:branched-chain amino acid transport system permease protein